MCVCVRFRSNGSEWVYDFSLNVRSWQVMTGCPGNRPGPGPSERRGRAAGVQEKPGWGPAAGHMIWGWLKTYEITI